MKRIAFFFLLVNVLLIPLVLAVPSGEDTGTIDTGQPVSGNVSLPNSTVYYPDGTACTAASQCSGGYCNSGVCASSAPSAAGPGGGGAAAVTTTAAAAAAVVNETHSVSAIASGATETVTILKSDDLKLQEIKITTSSAVADVKITIKESSLPTGATLAIAAAEGATYKYLEITKVNLADANIAKVKIKFKVEKTWIDNNNIASTSVALQRYADGKWNKLSTTQLSEDSNYFYYEAESPGLSVFAVTGEKKAAVQQACPYDCCKGEVSYYDKACSAGYECKSNKCVAVAPPACPTCPQPSAWSDCVDGKQSRTNYRCSAETDYFCQSYTETQDCVVPTPPVNWKAILLVAVFILLVAVIIYWFFIRK